jgi:hypothetical protein
MPVIVSVCRHAPTIAIIDVEFNTRLAITDHPATIIAVTMPFARRASVYSYSFCRASRVAASQAAGVLNVAAYVHFSGSLTAVIAFSAPHTKLALIERLGPFQQFCPLVKSMAV